MSLKSMVSMTCVLAVSGSLVLAQDADPQPDSQPDPNVAQLEARVEEAQTASSEAKAQLDSANAVLETAQAALDELTPPKSLTLTQGWSFDAQAGLNGSTGNTEKYNYRFVVNGTRDTDRLSTTLRMSYQYENAEGAVTDNRFVIDGRNDWKLEDSKWRVFVNGMYEYDEFQDWDQRYSGFLGLGYEITDNAKHTLIGRGGLGGNQTIGGEDETLTPEGFLGLDYTWRVKDGQKFKAGTTFLPSLDELTQYRLNSYAEYQLVLSKESSMILTAGAEHRFDSDPGTARHNDLDYYLTLGWKF